MCHGPFPGRQAGFHTINADYRDWYLPGYQSLAVEFVGGMMSEIIIAAIEVVAVNLESCNFHPTFEQPWEMDNLVPISHAGD
jgi:hypothetical protein